MGLEASHGPFLRTHALTYNPAACPEDRFAAILLYWPDGDTTLLVQFEERPTMTTNGQKPRTMFDKIWDAHVVHAEPGKQEILYIDLHLVHEVTSPQAFEGLRLAGRMVRRPERTIATADHNVPTTDRGLPIADPISKQQIDTLRENCRQFGIRLYDLNDSKQGIVHIIGPELGLTQPGMTIVCGDSHTATHGALVRWRSASAPVRSSTC